MGWKEEAEAEKDEQEEEGRKPTSAIQTVSVQGRDISISRKMSNMMMKRAM